MTMSDFLHSKMAAVLTVVLVLLAIWYAGAVALNTPFQRDQVYAHLKHGLTVLFSCAKQLRQSPEVSPGEGMVRGEGTGARGMHGHGGEGRARARGEGRVRGEGRARGEGNARDEGRARAGRSEVTRMVRRRVGNDRNESQGGQI